MSLLGGLLLGCDRRVPEWRRRSDREPSAGRSRTSNRPGLRMPRAGSPLPSRRSKGEPIVTRRSRPIDTKQLTDVVKEEVKGGEASEGPTPFDYLWSASKPELIKDEPLAVKVPARAAAAHAQDLRARRQPDHEGQSTSWAASSTSIPGSRSTAR